MQTEIEAKWLDIDPDELRSKLKAVGAKLIKPERPMKRKNFDFPKGGLQKIGGWVRVRDEGGKITMTYKQLNDRTLHGTKEVNLVIDNFDAACELMKAIGLVQTSYQETRRESWKINDVEIEIDTWPWIPTFVEIEAPSEAPLRETAKKLDLDMSVALHGSVEVAYQKYFDATEEEIDNWPELVFDRMPEGLEAKRKQA